MISLQSVSIQGFKSFREHTVVEFPTTPGLYFITGDNQVQPDLQANGVGKSNIFDAVVWCLYGMTTRKLKANNIISWNYKGKTEVSTTLVINGKEIVITRTQKPNKIFKTVEGETTPTTEDEIEHLIKVSRNTFLTTIVFSQFNSHFFDLTASKKQELFSEWMQLEYWDTASKLAKDKASHADAMIHDMEVQTAEWRGKKDALKSLDLKSLETQWKLDQDKRITELQRLIEESKAFLKDARKSGKRLESKINEKDVQAAEYDEEFAEASALFREVEEMEIEQVSAIARVNAKLSSITSEIEKFERMEGTCIECHQEIPAEYKQKQISKLETSQYKLQEEASSVKAELKSVREQKKEVKELIDELDQEAGKIRNELYTLNSQKRELQRDVTRVMNESKRYGYKIDDIKREVNPHSIKIEENEHLIQQLREWIKQNETAIEASNKDLTAFKFWVKEFKNVRLMLINQRLEELTIVVNNALYSLGLHDWRIEFDVSRETQTGTLRNEFVVLIHTPELDMPVPWESWSGGETQRLRLACNFGLSQLILSCYGLTSKLEVWDEPSAWMSEKGLNDLAEALKARAEELGKIIILIDHQITDSDQVFDGVYKVTRNSSSSTVERVN